MEMHAAERDFGRHPARRGRAMMAQLETFLRLLLEQNQHLNLTAVQDWDSARAVHLEDSLTILPVLDQLCASGKHKGISVIDVGTGAGLPGMVLAVTRPEWQVTLLDSLKKRCTFLEAGKAALQLKNASIVWSRAETAGQGKQYRERHDFAIARAVARLNVLAELCLPFVRPGGYWIAMKGPDPQAEVQEARAAFKALGAGQVDVVPLEWCGQKGQRTAVVVHKRMRMAKQYPRQEGIPHKRPLQ
ncbi:hypothetical protein WJX73_003230 [Symbiochloris irregularis]|uniref:Ribosomal RNA small subunit methyltransferase G n=1 Tax=Symbiochloris irregularis TaxID=706552 RepID=A0AAW1PGH5_9CHLO